MTLAAASLSPAFLGGGCLVVSAVWAWQLSRQPDAARPIGWRWWALLGAAMLCLRWPLLWVPHQQNPDESQLIAGAITLRHDPVFWRSVDGGTAGPFDFFPLLPAAWGDGTASYAIARFVAVVVVFFTLVLAGETAARWSGAALARFAVLPAAAFYAFTTHPDFNHYSTELMPGLLLAAAGYVALRGGPSPSSRRLWLCGFLLGSVLWAKLQAVPLAFALGSLVALREIQQRRFAALFPLLAGAALPAVLFLGEATLAGEIENLLLPYFVQNLAYVQAPQFTWIGVATAQWDNARLDGYLALWMIGAATLVALGLTRVRQPEFRSQRGLIGAAVVLLAAGVFSALGPRRPSTHHLYLLVLPLLWLTAATLPLALSHPALRRRAGLTGILFLAIGFVPLVAWRVAAPDPFAGINTSGVSAERRGLVHLVRALSTREEPLAMWGWRCSLYVEAGRRQATRQAHTEAQIYESPLQPYFLQRYLSDFQAAEPPVFADAVGPGNFAFTSPRFAHEMFPALREIIRTRYTLVTTLDGTRVYARNDRLAVLKGSLPAGAGE